MGSISVGTLTTGGCSYTCTITYDTPTRSGDKVKIKNVKAKITSSSGSQTRNRIAVSVSINGTSKASNKEIKRANQYDDYWPTSAEVTIVDSYGFEFNCWDTSFSISATFRSTGYGSDWDSDYGSASKSTTISCPERTYSVTFNANGGSGAPASQTKTYNVALTLSSTIPTRSGYAFNGWATSANGAVAYAAGASYTGNADLALYAVWEAQASALNDVAETDIGSAPNISWNVLNAGFTFALEFSIGNWSDTVTGITPGSTGAYSYDSYTLPMAACNQLPNTTSGIMTVVLTTYNGSTVIGTSEKTFTVNVPESAVPSVTATYADAGQSVVTGFVQSISRIRAALSASGSYGSTVNSVSLVLENKSYVAAISGGEAEILTDIIASSGSLSIKVSATDSRGRSSTVTGQITVMAYSVPTIDASLTVLDAESVSGHFGWSISSLDSQNSAWRTVKVYDFGGELVYITTNPSENFSVTGYVTDLDTKNYKFVFSVTDKFRTTTLTKWVREGEGNRFYVLDESEYYIGITHEGFKDTASGITGQVSDGKITVSRTSGNTASGIGLPIELDGGSTYEFIYGVDTLNDNTIVSISYWTDDFTYISTTSGQIRPGDIFTAPSTAAWGLIILGVKGAGSREFSSISIRQTHEPEEEEIEWMVETGNLGLDTPNQKYISRIQMRIDYAGTLKVGIAYDNEKDFTQVHASVSDHMRSITVPINVRRCDHFRIRMDGVGQVKLYSLGYVVDEGGERCLI